jgi:hypothetical protein
MRVLGSLSLGLAGLAIAGLVIAGLAIVSLAFPRPASAASHLWRFSEFYSSPDKQIQFIEMQEIGGSNNETAIQGHWYATNSFNHDHSQILGTPLPFGTANKKFLVGSQSYAALPGVPAPDYIVPDGIIEPSGDIIVWWFYQTLQIPPDTMPTNGTNSLHVNNPANPSLGFHVGPNSPTNFAGETGTVGGAIPIPATSAWGVASSVALLLLSSWALALRQRRRRPAHAASTPS